jgi:RecA-family ATPase
MDDGLARCERWYPQEWTNKLVVEAAENCTPPFDRAVALEKVERAYATTTTNPPPPPSQDKPEEEIGVLMSDVQAEQVEWLWEGRISHGKLTILDGDPGVGKGVITMDDVAASVTTGRTFPNGEHLEHVGHVGGVVILSAEDGLADTIRPRGDVAGVEVGSIVAISTVPDGQGNERTISIPEDVATIVEVIRRVGAKLVIVDPLMAFLSGKANYDQDDRKALTPLARMAESTGVAMLVARHLNKQQGGKAIYRGGSSIGIIGAARSGLVVETYPDDKDLRLLATSKSNLAMKADSLTYTIVTADNDTAKVAWVSTTNLDADDILNPDTSELHKAEA